MTTKYTVIILTESELTGDLLLKRIFETPNALDETAFKQAVNEALDDFVPADGRVTSSRPVVVIGIDAAVNARFLETADHVPANGQYAQPVEVDQEFPSAIAASRYLGLKNNEVALYLQKVRHVANPEDRVAKIRGCTVQYKDDYHAGLLANLRD